MIMRKARRSNRNSLDSPREKYGLKKDALNKAHPRISEHPFDSERKLMSTLNIEGKGYRVHTKGAIDNLLEICTQVLINGQVVPLTFEMKQKYLAVTEKMSQQALRVLATAYKDTETPIEPCEMEKDLTFLGLVGMIDPPRLEVRDSIQKARRAGVTPVMITGDHKITAFAIAKDLGIAETIEQCITGAELDMLSDEEFAQQVNNYRVLQSFS